MTRRAILLAGACAWAGNRRARADAPVRIGLTPVVLDNEIEVVAALRAGLSRLIARPVEILQRRTYQEVTGLLLAGGVDAAWICGYPLLQHQGQLSLLAVPRWRQAPLYRSYLIAGRDDPAEGLADLAGGVHAFSDPDSNSGWLVTASDLVRMGTDPNRHFGRTIFTYGHRNVVRAVASGLVRSGSVDGYVWEVLARREPQLTARTRILKRSEEFGFPPFAGRRADRNTPLAGALRAALLALSTDAEGAKALRRLELDGLIAGDPSLYDGVRRRMADLGP